MVLEAAANGHADAIVTVNRSDHGTAPDRFGIEVLSPAGTDVPTKLTTFSLRLPLSLKAAVEQLFTADGTSMNQFLVMAAAEKSDGRGVLRRAQGTRRHGCGDPFPDAFPW